jgi:hypothetical protein
MIGTGPAIAACRIIIVHTQKKYSSVLNPKTLVGSVQGRASNNSKAAPIFRREVPGIHLVRVHAPIDSTPRTGQKRHVKLLH